MLCGLQSIALDQFHPDPLAARELVTASRSTELCNDPSLQPIENLLDYGWLSDPARFGSLSTNIANPGHHHVCSDASASSDESSILNAKDIEGPSLSEARIIPTTYQDPLGDRDCDLLKEFNLNNDIRRYEDLDMNLENHLELPPIQDPWDNFFVDDNQDPLAYSMLTR